jgi:hypothetical protein
MWNRSWVAKYLTAFFGLLFSTTAFIKLMNMEKFEAKLTAFPALSSVSPMLHWLIPVFEILIAISLFIRKTSVLGLYLACWWFVLLTGFILLVLNARGVVPYFYEESWYTLILGPQLLLNNVAIIVIAIFLIKNRSRKKTNQYLFTI